MTVARLVPVASVLAVMATLAPGASAEESPASPQSKATPAGPSQSGLSLDETAAFARARSFYEANDYRACAQTFSDLLNPDSPDRFKKPHVIEQARTYYAACLIGLGKVKEADEQMQLGIRANPLMSPPDPLVFPAAVSDRFFAVRSQLLAEIRHAEELRVQQLQRDAEKAKEKDEAFRARIEELERLAATEAVVQKNSRWLASVPFGVGQFQNRDTGLGWLFLSGETVFAGAALTAVSVELGLNAQANGGNTTKDTAQINHRLRLAHTIEIGAAVSFLTVAALGILEANLSFVPEIDLGKRRRKLPPATGVSVTPVAAPLSDGGLLGVSGRF